ncbi:MAG: hypothetical protein ACYC3S_06495 [Chloroflexota bacterium]
MEEKPGHDRPGPRINREQMGERIEEGAEGVFDWAATVADWVMAPPFLPRTTRDHLHAARREMLLAARTLIDKSIERTEEATRRHEPPKATKINVE